VKPEKKFFLFMGVPLMRGGPGVKAVPFRKKSFFTNFFFVPPRAKVSTAIEFEGEGALMALPLILFYFDGFPKGVFKKMHS